MITLYHSPGTAGMVVHWLLIELGVPHTLRMLDFAKAEHKTPAYLALNPSGVVPTLIVNDGGGDTVLNESAAIAMYLADSQPAAGFAPAATPGSLARAAYHQWMLFLTNTVMTSFRAWFYPHEPAAGEGHIEAVKEAARGRIESAWDRLDRRLAAHGPYMLGERPTTVDFHLVMLMRWSRNMPRPATEWPALAKLAAAMKARPSWRELNTREGLTDWQ
ncbi:MAG TPA: glutathione S-transferase family protein [Kofleriaceae bacterium]|nr:glutathione S-transferase family protein [Kofleriaceae bacterium]